MDLNLNRDFEVVFMVNNYTFISQYYGVFNIKNSVHLFGHNLKAFRFKNELKNTFTGIKSLYDSRDKIVNIELVVTTLKSKFFNNVVVQI